MAVGIRNRAGLGQALSAVNLLAVCLIASPALSYHAPPPWDRRAVETYIHPIDAYPQEADRELFICGAHMGGACFDVLEGERSFRMIVSDVTGSRRWIDVEFYRSFGAVEGASFCLFNGSIGPLTSLPTGTVMMLVHVREMVNNACTSAGAPPIVDRTFLGPMMVSVSTAGTIDVRFFN